MPLYKVETLERHLRKCVYRRVEAEDVEHAKEQVREGSVAYDQATTEDDPGEVETVLSVEEEE